MEAHEYFLALGVALVVGTLIGFEREQAYHERHKSSVPLGGARTQPLFALLGATSAIVAQKVGAVAFAIALAGLLVLISLSYLEDVRAGDRGLTSEAALLLTFLLGALAATPGIVEPFGQRMLLVLATAVVATFLLSAKAPLHAFIEKLSLEDMFAALKFLIVAVVVLPLLPDRAYGPLEVLNPLRIGLMAVLIAAIGFVGYVAVRLYGPRRGLGMTGALGGLASSTAVTLSFSGRAKGAPGPLAESLALGVVLASSIMFVRILVAVAVVNASLVHLLVIPLSAMGTTGLIASGVLYRRTRKVLEQAADVKLHNPFELWQALRFALLYAVVLWVSKAATTHLGTGATYAAGVLAGLSDVDAITLSMANLSRAGLRQEVAVTTILLAAASNTVVKAGMAVVVGGWPYGRKVAIALGIVIAAGLAALIPVWIG